jgi:isoamylase
MILMGDEVRRSQQGNNNSYCHDNKTNWLDWTLLEKHTDVHRFVSLLNARRATRNLDPNDKSLTIVELLQSAQREWHGTRLHQPDWSDCSHSLALSVALPHQGLIIHWILNAFWEPLDFELPRVDMGGDDPWRRWIDTTLDSPEDIVDWDAMAGVPGFTYSAGPRSVVLLCADLKKPGAMCEGISAMQTEINRFEKECVFHSGSS